MGDRTSTSLGLFTSTQLVEPRPGVPACHHSSPNSTLKTTKKTTQSVRAVRVKVARMTACYARRQRRKKGMSRVQFRAATETPRARLRASAPEWRAGAGAPDPTGASRRASPRGASARGRLRSRTRSKLVAPSLTTGRWRERGGRVEHAVVEEVLLHDQVGAAADQSRARARTSGGSAAAGAPRRPRGACPVEPHDATEVALVLRATTVASSGTSGCP